MILTILGYILAILVVAFVLEPLFKKQRTLLQDQGKQAKEYLVQLGTSQDTLRDIELDLQTGKLDQDDYQQVVQESLQEQQTIREKIARLAGMSYDKWQHCLLSEIGEKPQKQEQNVCPQCGAPVTFADHFCAQCGHKIKS
jgi:rubrerythrin